MNKNIIDNLKKLSDIYKKIPKKKFQLRAIDIAISKIKKYDQEIKNGEQIINDIKGIGKGIGSRIDEIIETNTLKEFALYKDDDYTELLQITGIGMVKAKELYSQGIKNVNDLRIAIKEKGLEVTHHINIGIKYYEDLLKRIPRYEIFEFDEYFGKIIHELDKDLIYEICGSARRGTEDSGDIDIAVSNKKILQNIDKKNYLQRIVEKMRNEGVIIDSLTENGNKKYMGVCKFKKYARRIDIRVFDYESYIPALIYFTGSKNFNVLIRQNALKLGYSLNEYGMVRLDDPQRKLILFHSEEELFKFIGMEYISPEKRNI